MSMTVIWRCDYCGKTVNISHHREPPRAEGQSHWKLSETLPQVAHFAKPRQFVFCTGVCERDWEAAIHTAYLQAQAAFFGAVRAHQIQARGNAIDSLADLSDDVTRETFVPITYDPPTDGGPWSESDLPF